MSSHSQDTARRTVDPLFDFLTTKLGFKIWHVLLGMLGINVIRTILLPWQHHDVRGGELFSDPGVKDVQAFLISFIVHPILVFVYWRSATAVPAAFEALQKNQVIKNADSQALQDFFKRQLDETASKWIVRIWLVLIILVIFGFNLSWHGSGDPTRYPPYGAYPYEDWQSLLIETPYGFFTISFAMWAVWRGLVFAETMRLLWANNEIDLQPFAEDGAGGLKVIGDFTLLAGLLTGGLSLFVAASFWANKQNPDDLIIVYVMIAMTILIAPVAFYALIWPTHKQMQKAKKQKLDMLGKELHDCWETQANDTEIGAIDTERVLALVEIRDAIQRDYPVWPFQHNLGAYLLRYLTTVIAPLVLSEFIPGIDLLFDLVRI